MRRGFSLAEVMVTLTIVALVSAIAVPRLNGLLDWVAVDSAAREVTTPLAVARNAGILQAARARLAIAADSLRIDRWGKRGWEAVARWPGPGPHGVALEVTNPEVVFGPMGIGWGASNTRVVLRRGSHAETITTSRLGRVKRW